MKSYLPYKLQSLLNWMKDNKISPIILVDQNTGYTNISTEPPSGNIIVIDISAPPISDFVVTTEGIKFNLLLNNEIKMCFASIDAVISVVSKEDGVGYMVSGISDVGIQNSRLPPLKNSTLH